MTAALVPVLALRDVVAGMAHLTGRLGFDAIDAQTARFGTQTLRLCALDAPPNGLVRLRLDHLALRVASADVAHARFLDLGAVRHRGFTPDGPRDIPQFHAMGVRFVFFEGPEGWPFEFCETLGAADVAEGGDHFGIRSNDLDMSAGQIAAYGAIETARYALPGPVNVRFVRAGTTVFELFDEPGTGQPAPDKGFIGFLPGRD